MSEFTSELPVHEFLEVVTPHGPADDLAHVGHEDVHGLCVAGVVLALAHVERLDVGREPDEGICHWRIGAMQPIMHPRVCTCAA